MPNALRTTAEVRADLARKVHDAGRVTVADPHHELIHGEIDVLLEELAMLERLG